MEWEKVVIDNKLIFISDTIIGMPNINNTTEHYWMIFCDIELMDDSLLSLEISTPYSKCNNSKEFRKLVLPSIVNMLNAGIGAVGEGKVAGNE